MATLKIREYSRIGSAGSLSNGAGNIAVADESAVVDQTPVTFTSTAVSSAAFAASTRYVSVKADVAFCYSIGATPTATVNMIDQPAGQVYFFAVTPGVGQKISVITAT